MSNSSHLLRYWHSWQSKLDTLVRTRKSKLRFPNMREIAGTRNPACPDVITYGLEEPMLILDAPQKGSSKRETKRLHIMLDGGFTFKESAGHPCLLSAKCNLMMFHPTVNDESNKLDLELVDALHFDVETPAGDAASKGFHPFFHVQRGISNKHDDLYVRQIFAKHTDREAGEVEVNWDAKDRIGHPTLRIPTPQLDLFSVITMIVADCFCNPAEAGASAARTGGSGTPAEVLFVDLLKLLTESGNIVRESLTSQSLTERITSAKLMSAGHWYPEYA